MIAGVSRHARTQRDSRALVGHLLKPENNPRTIILSGTLAADLPSAVRDMERLRDSTSAAAAALHIHLSPARAMTYDELKRAAEIVIGHFGAAAHPAVLVTHEKERHDGAGHRHAHLVLGRVSPSGAVLESGFEKIRLETAARLIEYEMSEPATLGRHHKSAVRWLRNNNRADVASWLEAAHGADPERPQSTGSPEKRQALARQGINLSEVRAEIRTAWKDGGAEAVREVGFEITPGRKEGLWIVARDGVEIGSLDRLVGEKRAAIQVAMDAAPDLISRKDSKSEVTQRNIKPSERSSEHVASDPSSEKPASFRAVRAGLGRWRDPLYGRKKSDAELVSEAAAEQARQFAEGFRARLDDRLAVAAAHRWIEDRRAALKGAILESARSTDDAAAHRELTRRRRELAVLDAAETALRADPTLAFGGEKALMGTARRLHAERTAATHKHGTPHKDAGKPSNSRFESSSENSQSSQKPIQRDSELSMDDPSSEKGHRRHSLEKAVAAAGRFLDSLDAKLRGQIAELSRPDKLPEPAELTDTRRRLAAAACELASWEARHGTRVTELRLQIDAGRPHSFWAWVSGATGRYAAAARELSELFEEREPLLTPVAKARREVNILQTAQETRQAVHDADRINDLARLKGELSLLPDARAALKADPTIAQGGGKALADAARKRQTERRAEERRRDAEAARREQWAPAPGM